MGVLTNHSLFSGAGGLDLGAKLVGGFRTVCYVEKDPYAQGVLMSRMRDGGLDEAPIYDDVQTFRGGPWRGAVDCVSGGFPCQDLSVAGTMEGLAGDRSGLWKEFARIVGEVRPRFVLVENVAGLLLFGQLGEVLGDLAVMGFDAQWEVLRASDVGAPHERRRVFIVAHSNKIRFSGGADEGSLRPMWSEREEQPSGFLQTGVWMGKTKADISGMDDGMAFGMERAGCCGNGVVPQESARAWQRIKDIAGEI